ncbi:uncharacterized protein BYT42DRAFT_492758 [Radiomyces spectabilis]|uniref:uncharacterized protein n=1 Tax=Radiomyces spectabilis TaxID=64574 RepID=UPI00222057C4|nr:uncharacterized protein BYT42DRAFT_492758 [Radiomyces spectabilis]KAI8384753.1 hypothetical protein BYT42DRAFT_492758 [Radiomyces spectabilis]
MATLQCVLIIVLQTVICSQNTLQADLLPHSGSDNALITDSIQTSIPEQAADRLGRIKWENIAFIGFQVWFLGMAFDATVYQNTAEILALAILNVICAILGALEVVDGNKWLNLLKNTGYSTMPLSVAEKIEIALSVMIMLFAVILAYLSYEMSRQFGWNIYKKIGADVQIQKMYRMFQFFVLSLKIDVFTGFLVSLFSVCYLIHVAIKQGLMWESVIELIVTVLILPMLYFARTAGSVESKVRMIIFLIFQVLEFVHYCLILTETFQPSNNWYTWIVLIFIGLAFNVITSVLAFMCMRNFGKGLKPYVQRGSTKQKQDVEMNKSKVQQDWQIDDD